MSPLACCKDCPDTAECVDEGCVRYKASREALTHGSAAHSTPEAPEGQTKWIGFDKNMEERVFSSHETAKRHCLGEPRAYRAASPSAQIPSEPSAREEQETPERRDLASRLAAQYGAMQVATLRGDNMARAAAQNWLHIVADGHWHEIIAALRQRDEANARAGELERKYREEVAIVDRVWKALGIATYEQAKPYAIDEHVERLRARAEKNERDAESTRSRLAGAIKALEMFKPIVAPRDWPNYATQVLDLHRDEEQRRFAALKGDRPDAG